MQKIVRFSDLYTVANPSHMVLLESMLRANCRAICNYDPERHGYVALMDCSDEPMLLLQQYEAVYKDRGVYVMYVVTGNDSCNTYVIPFEFEWSAAFRQFLEEADECSEGN